jgi:7,8-dihydro-6-hydroxymethylpterin-pyrophosphokinase
MNSMASGAEFPSTVFLGLGSNLGDRVANLRSARERIESLGPKIINASSIYETEPVGHMDQPWFLNQVIELERSSLNQEAVSRIRGVVKAASPFAPEFKRVIEIGARIDPNAPASQPSDIYTWMYSLFYCLQAIERMMGRVRNQKNGPRVIDIDVLLFGDRSFFSAATGGDNIARVEGIDPAGLTIPHPRMHERRFVLEPLCEIAPNVLHPALNATISELLNKLEDHSIVRRIAPA